MCFLGEIFFIFRSFGKVCCRFFFFKKFMLEVFLVGFFVEIGVGRIFNSCVRVEDRRKCGWFFEFFVFFLDI